MPLFFFFGGGSIRFFFPTLFLLAGKCSFFFEGRAGREGQRRLPVIGQFFFFLWFDSAFALVLVGGLTLFFSRLGRAGGKSVIIPLLIGFWKGSTNRCSV